MFKKSKIGFNSFCPLIEAGPHIQRIEVWFFNYSSGFSNRAGDVIEEVCVKLRLLSHNATKLI